LESPKAVFDFEKVGGWGKNDRMARKEASPWPFPREKVKQPLRTGLHPMLRDDAPSGLGRAVES